MCQALCKPRGHSNSFHSLNDSSRHSKTPHFTDGHTEAQWDKVSYHGVELGFALTSVFLPLSVPRPEMETPAGGSWALNPSGGDNSMPNLRTVATGHSGMGLARKPLVPMGTLLSLLYILGNGFTAPNLHVPNCKWERC